MILWGMWGIPYTTCIRIFLMLLSLILPSAWRLTHSLSPPCRAVQHWDAEMETSRVSVVQAHFAPHSTDIRHLPTGHYRWQGMMLPVFFPAFQITIAIHQKAILRGQTWCSFICSPTALLFCTGLEMAVFLCQDLDDFKTVLPFKEPYIFIENQN